MTVAGHTSAGLLQENEVRKPALLPWEGARRDGVFVKRQRTVG